MKPKKPKKQRKEREPKAPKKPKPFKTYVIALIIVALGSLVVGFVGGLFTQGAIQSMYIGPEPSAVEDQAETDNTIKMPDLRGLNVTDAKQALTDIGLDPNAVKLKTTPWSGSPDVVIRQSPVSGENVSKKTIELTVSTEAKVPKVLGTDKGKALAALQNLGNQVLIKETFDGTVSAGTVLSVSPQEGQTLPGTVTLTVAQAGSSIFLSELQQISGSSYGSCGETSVSINGKKYDKALRCYSSDEGKYSASAWLVGRHGDVLDTVVGISDTDSAEDWVQVQVFADGKQVAAANAQFGKPATLKAVIRGALQVEIRATSNNGASYYLGDPLVKGLDQEIDQLEKDS